MICNTMCVQLKVNQFHTTLPERRYAVASQRLHLFLFFFTRSCHLDDTRREINYFIPFSVSQLHQPYVPTTLPPCVILSVLLKGEAGPRWRSPRLQTRPRWVCAQAGHTEPSAGTKRSGGPLSRPAPGGCAGSWRPLSASACGAPGTPPGLARAPRAPVPASFP